MGAERIIGAEESINIDIVGVGWHVMRFEFRDFSCISQRAVLGTMFFVGLHVASADLSLHSTGTSLDNLIVHCA